jgi:hypothetical protein
MSKPKYREMRKIQSVTIRGKRYKFLIKRNLIKHEEAHGITDPPSKKGKTVMVDPDQSPKEMLATLIDEFIHCGIWELDNDVVDEVSDSLAHALWRCGLRFVDEAEEG